LVNRKVDHIESACQGGAGIKIRCLDFDDLIVEDGVERSMLLTTKITCINFGCVGNRLDIPLFSRLPLLEGPVGGISRQATRGENKGVWVTTVMMHIVPQLASGADAVGYGTDLGTIF